MAEKLMTIPLSSLCQSAVNVRKTDIKRDLEELAASIAAHGLLQNLTVRAAGANGKKPVADYEVVVGGRRLAAFKLLVKRKHIASDYPVPCQVVAHDDAVATRCIGSELSFLAWKVPQIEGSGFTVPFVEFVGVDGDELEQYIATQTA